MTLDIHTLQDKLIAQFGNQVGHFGMQRDIFALEAQPAVLHPLIAFLKEDAECQFHFLTDVCGIHYPDMPADQQFAVVYHLHNWIANVRIRVKVFLAAPQPEVDTVSDLFPSANWMERETYDFYGIQFKGHPQLKRILNMDEMESFPLRKEFPLEDGGRTDKDDRFFGRTQTTC